MNITFESNANKGERPPIVKGFSSVVQKIQK